MSFGSINSVKPLTWSDFNHVLGCRFSFFQTGCFSMQSFMAWAFLSIVYWSHSSLSWRLVFCKMHQVDGFVCTQSSRPKDMRSHPDYIQLNGFKDWLCSVQIYREWCLRLLCIYTLPFKSLDQYDFSSLIWIHLFSKDSIYWSDIYIYRWFLFQINAAVSSFCSSDNPGWKMYLTAQLFLTLIIINPSWVPN